MEKKHVLILGAGLMQKPAVEAAHKLGCRVTLIDANPQAVCRTLAEKFEQIDLKNTEQICDFARSLKKSEGLDAVFTAGTDFSYAVACAAHECNLSAHTSQAAKNASDKVLMRSCFDKAGVPSPHFVQADSSFAAFNQKQAEDFIHKHKLDFPLVVKPCDNMGARGCRLVRGAESLADAVKDALRYSRTFRVIIEEYMDGSEFSIDSLVFDGQLTVTGFAERHIYFPPYFIEMGHTMPALIDKTDKERLLSAFWSGVKALGLSCGAAKADIKMTSKGPMIGEIAARLSGGYMSGWTYPYASQMNLTEQALLLALGEKPAELLQRRRLVGDTSDIFDVPCSHCSAERAWISIPGKIAQTMFFKKAANTENVVNFFPRIQSGQTAVFPVNNVEKAGNVISRALERNKAIEAAQTAVQTVFLRLQADSTTGAMSTNAASDGTAVLYGAKDGSGQNCKDTHDFLNAPLNTLFPPSAFVLPDDVIRKIDSLDENEYTDTVKSVALLPFLEKYAQLKDWNGKTLQKTLDLYNDLFYKEQGKAVRLSVKKLWHYFIRGGLQGAVFYTDSKIGEHC